MNKIFCIPGREETLPEFFENFRLPNGVEIGGFEIIGQFSKLNFDKQINAVNNQITEHYWHKNNVLIGRSFGSWIILNSLLALDKPFPGPVILISSVLGHGGVHGFQFTAPGDKRFWNEVRKLTRPMAHKIMLIHAVDDEQCPHELATKLAKNDAIKLFSMESGGHSVGKTLSDLIFVETILQLVENDNINLVY